MADKELVIDLETANTPNNVPGKRDLVLILSVGIVAFDPAQTNTFNELREWDSMQYLEATPNKQYVGDDAFYTPVSFMQSLSHGFHCGADTLEFWKDQVVKKGSYNMVEAASSFTEDIKFTFAKIDQFLRRHHDAKRIWCRDQSFDATVLREAFNHLGFTLPLNPFSLRDHRCISDSGLFNIPFPPRDPEALPHHALHDAVTEAMMRQTLYAKLNPVVVEPEPVKAARKPRAKVEKKPAKVTVKKSKKR